jgi:hypothetical protein
MSALYKGHFSSAVCEGISKIGWPVVGVLFFLTSHQLFIYSSQYGGYYGKKIINKKKVFMLGKALEHRLYWNWAFCLTWALISGPQAFTLC